MIWRTVWYGRVDMKMVTFLVILLFSSVIGISQSTETINLEKIPQKKVRKYIKSRSIDRMNDFSLIHSSWKKDNTESDFNVIEKSFYLKSKLSSIWNLYRNATLARVWNKRSVRFGLLISKRSNSVTYANSSSFPEIDTGQIYFLNLRLLKGLYNVPVAFEITTIDQVHQIVEFSYLENNVSKGKQTLQFFDNGEGSTKIVHRSYFKSKSSLRDELFYPPFHKKFIKEFHKNMRQQVKNKKPPVAYYDSHDHEGIVL
ncbi:MAG TPA: hypothetical protein PLR88_09170 [Bacteroidales bacterium]|nr:hypothetical protein [Bacteroidales bacterium]HPT22101.1 hypothetical protein [Bacteroidales bacterium]